MKFDPNFRQIPGLSQPYKWKKPKRIFVNSMSDMFHDDIPDDFIQQVFATMNETPQHNYQILTKRSQNMLNLSKDLLWTDNIWMGVTVENANYVDCIDHLRQTNANIKFICFEPLLGPINNLDLSDIDWAILGGESGINARPMEKEWAIDIKNQSVGNRIPFFFKQWGGRDRQKGGRIMEGRTWDEYPHDYKAEKINEFF
ncbi:MAG: phage Gp37/Gp68 family protein [Calditrichia bacterium]|nr:phage Gp37/Gp68 family protein [Calditrichia bacterium]